MVTASSSCPATDAMTRTQRNGQAATFRLIPWLTIDIDVDTVGLGPLLFTFNIPGTLRLYINLAVKVFGFNVLYGHIAII